MTVVKYHLVYISYIFLKCALTCPASLVLEASYLTYKLFRSKIFYREKIFLLHSCQMFMLCLARCLEPKLWMRCLVPFI